MILNTENSCAFDLLLMILSLLLGESLLKNCVIFGLMIQSGNNLAIHSLITVKKTTLKIMEYQYSLCHEQVADCALVS